MNIVQGFDFADMYTASVPSHSRNFRLYSDPKFQYFQSPQSQHILREGRNVYMLFDTTGCRLTEKSILDELHLCAGGIRLRSCQFRAFVRLMIHVQEGQVVEAIQMDGNAHLVPAFIETLLTAHGTNPHLHDLEVRSPMGFRKTYRLYYLKPAILQKKHRASEELLGRIIDLGKNVSVRQIASSLSGNNFGYVTEGAMICKQVEAAKDIIFAGLNDIRSLSHLTFSDYGFSTTALADLDNDVLAGITLFTCRDLNRNVSVGCTLSELAGRQTISSLRNCEIYDKTILAFAISYKHCHPKDWRNRIGMEQTFQLRHLLKEVIRWSRQTGFGDSVAIWSDVALRVRVPSRYKFWPQYGLEPFARFTSIALTPKILTEGHIRTERVWLYLETFLANQSGGCVMMSEKGEVKRCRWRDDISARESLHNLAVHLIQHNVLWKRDAANWGDKEAIQSWAYALLGMGHGAWADQCGRLVNLMQVVEAEIATLPFYSYRERSFTRTGLESSWTCYLLQNICGSWLAADRHAIYSIDKKFGEVSQEYRTGFMYHLTRDFAQDEVAYIVPLDKAKPSREITSERRSETFFWRRNQYEEFALMFQRVYDPDDPKVAILYRVMRLTGRCYITVAASLSQTAKEVSGTFMQIVGAD